MDRKFSHPLSLRKSNQIKKRNWNKKYIEKVINQQWVRNHVSLGREKKTWNQKLKPLISTEQKRRRIILIIIIIKSNL